jgi:AcrR family transcriptional regulator
MDGMADLISKKPSARQRLLDAGDELFYSEGVHAVGIDRILEKANVAKGSLYYNFAGGKDDLIEEYLNNRHGAWAATVESYIDQGNTPEQNILGVFDALEELFARPDFRGCAFMNATAEARPGSVEERAAARFRQWLHGLFTRLVAQLDVDSPELVTQLVVLYDGATTTAQMDRAPQAASSARRIAAMVLSAAATAETK